MSRDSDGEIDDRKRGAENRPKCIQKRRTKIGQAEAERKIVETVYHIFTTDDLLEPAETSDLEKRKTLRSLLFHRVFTVEVAGFEPAAFWSRNKRQISIV
jgi:hypothetical protein